MEAHSKELAPAKFQGAVSQSLVRSHAELMQDLEEPVFGAEPRWK